MARLHIGSATSTDTTATIQFLVADGVSSGTRVAAITMKARDQNSSHLYIGTTSALSSNTDYLIPTGGREDWSMGEFNVQSSTFWVKMNTSNDHLDFVAVLDI